MKKILILILVLLTLLSFSCKSEEVVKEDKPEATKEENVKEEAKAEQDEKKEQKQEESKETEVLDAKEEETEQNEETENISEEEKKRIEEQNEKNRAEAKIFLDFEEDLLTRYGKPNTEFYEKVKSNKDEKWLWPLFELRDISSPFGNRIHPIFHVQMFHNGIDVPGNQGTPIKVTKSGIVVEAKEHPGYGNYVVVLHKDGYHSLYGHATSLIVRKEQLVKQGETIAYMGSTGRSTASHLHFSIFKGSEWFDPLKLLDDTKVKEDKQDLDENE